MAFWWRRPVDTVILWGEMNKPCIAPKKIVFSCLMFTL